MFIVAITGGIATGKSTVSKMFEENGIPVVDADKIARDIVQPGKPCWHKIREVFGEAVFLPTKELDRKALGAVIFNDKDLRAKLNKITHPVIHRQIFIQIFKHFMSGRAYIVLDLPLLFETGILMDFIHKIITVTCEPEIQLQRLMERDEYTPEDAKKRIESQMPLDQKCACSHFVIHNSGDISDTKDAAECILDLMNSSNQHWHIRLSLLGCIFAVIFFIYYLNRFFDFLPNFRNVSA